MKNKLIPISVLISVFLVVLSLVYRAGSEKFVLPMKLENLEAKLVEAGVIDPEKFGDNMRTDLNILWAFGLANKNPILDGVSDGFEQNHSAR